MRAALSIPYAIAARAAEAIAAITPANSSSKVTRAFAARRNVLDRYHAWSNRHRDLTRPLLWIHAASVGESLMAQPVITAVKLALPDHQVAFTFYSPSAEDVAKTLGADFADYLPFDSRASANAAIDALAPSALVFTKGDVWPMLAEVASSRGVPLGLISGAMSARSRRAGGIGASITRAAYGLLSLVGAASEEDARAIIAAGASASRTRVTGDTRYDQAWERAQKNGVNDVLLKMIASYNGPTLVAGSTWSSDESVLLPAWIEVLKLAPRARLVIAPHEPDASACAAIRQWATLHHLSAASIGDARGDESVILVDRVGILADIYATATVAYIGGGFHSAGLHSLVEPAVYGAPVIVGPMNERSRDARLMLAAGGAVSVADAGEMARAIERLFYESDVRTSMSDAMRFVVARELGAAGRSFEIVRALLRPVQKKSLNEMNT